MTPEQDCGLQTILPMSYERRTDLFARRLESRLRSLGSQDKNDISNESHWKTKHENSIDVLPLEHFYEHEITDDFENSCCNKNLFSSLNGNSTNYSESKDIDAALDRLKLDSEAKEDIFLNNNYSAMHDSISNGNHSTLNGNLKHATETDLAYEHENIFEIDACSKCDANIERITDNELSNSINIVSPECYFSPLDIHSNLVINYEKAIPVFESENNLGLENEKFLEEKNDNTEEDEDCIPRVRRCSSLKTAKTPPDTPGRKKIVRFADVLGLDLADVRTFLDEIPKIPNSAFSDLCNADTSFDISITQKTLIALFQQPFSSPTFLDKVQRNNVSLETVNIDDPTTLSIKGVIRVRNLDFNKSVYVRYSLDEWKTFSDLQAVYIDNSCDGFSDKFNFLLYANTLDVGQRLEFAVRYQCKGSQYWDNYNGKNYCFQCMPITKSKPYEPIINGVEDHIASFYYLEKSKFEPKNDNETTELTSAAVQEYIMNSLQNNKKHEVVHFSKPELLTIFIVLLFGIVFLYIKRTIFF